MCLIFLPQFADRENKFYNTDSVANRNNGRRLGLIATSTAAKTVCCKYSIARLTITNTSYDLPVKITWVGVPYYKNDKDFLG